MDKYPTLNEMGITRAHEIAHYSLYMDGRSRDVLHVYYNREKGSFLAASRKYEFGRSARGIDSGSPDHETQEVFEISPFLLKAVAELDGIIGSREDRKDKIGVLNDELDSLEKMMQTRIEEIRNNINNL